MTAYLQRGHLIRLPLVLALAGLLLVACAAESDTTIYIDGPMGLSVHALTGTCGGEPNANPFASIKTISMSVRGDGLETAWRKDISLEGKSIVAKEVPAGSGREITLLGKDSAGNKLWFARKSGVKIVKNTQTDLEMTLMALDGFSCLGLESGKAASVVFPAVTRVGGGKVLITGGFALAKKSGSNMILTQPQDTAYIFDANTGALRELKNQERMKEGRGAHSAVYLPASNRVLIVGGAREMTAVTDKTGSPNWSPAKAANVTYEIFDVAEEKFLKPIDASLEWAVKRVFPNLMALSGDFVVSLGGAQWPTSQTSESTSYKNSDLYDPEANFDPTLNSKDTRKGAFINNFGGLPMTEHRGGAALAAAGTTSLGVSKYLIWGGGDTLAEVFTESSGLGDGTFDNTYIVQGDILTKKGSLYFATLTALSATEEQALFLSIGGIRRDGDKWLAPEADDVYLVVVSTPKSGSKRINTVKVSGLGAGLYMHQASLTDDNHVLVTGGFNKYGEPSSVTMRVFDIGAFMKAAAQPKSDGKKINLVEPAETGGLQLAMTEPPTAKSWIKRGGHGAVRLNNDCVLAFGGVTDVNVDLTMTNVEAATDVYCPLHLDPTL